MWYGRDPDGFADAYAEQTLAFAEEVEGAIARLPQVTITNEARDLGLQLTNDLSIASNRAEITLFEAARAHCAADGRDKTTPVDIRAVAMMALRLRHSSSLNEFFAQQENEDARVKEVLQ